MLRPYIVPFSSQMSLRVAPNPRSSSWTGDGVSSCPDSRILRRLRKPSSGLPRLLASPAPPSMSLRVAPNSTPSGLPTVSLRVSPDSRPSGLASGSVSRLPRFLRLWPASGWVSEFPRLLFPLAAPSDGSPGFPESRTLRRYRFRVFGALRILRLRLGR